eukprot:CAMPEP_0180469344 /NCGR_PEP_ID=MMETSP1036_2-20121128/28003_1 /TAXON_ID=632150 /ORGANISM="Azadinium spinosum, Strain 3D9" /LENGTH=46 /DNA_ID= /DNA_START= /DNA_END= /DNA_ORIENTATION=
MPFLGRLRGRNNAEIRMGAQASSSKQGILLELGISHKATFGAPPED